MDTVCTIGYEGSSFAGFVETLKRSKVQVVIDIRDVARSRKRGFSKTALEKNLRAEGLQYKHLRHLGNPRPGREAARRGDIDGMRRIFLMRMGEAEAQRELGQAIGIALRSPTCLLCFERDHECCHRDVVARMMTDMHKGLHVSHLKVTHPSSDLSWPRR